MRGRPTCPLRVLSALALFLMLSAASSFAQTNDLQQMLIQATGLAASGDTEQARALYRQLITTAPDTVYAGHAHLGLAKLHIAAREDDAALAELDLALAYASTTLISSAAVQKVTVLANRTLDYDQAVEVAEQYLDELGDLMPPFDRRLMIMQLAHAHDAAGRPEEALAVFRDELPLTPALLTLPLYYERLFDLHVKLGQRDEALSVARMGYALCGFDQPSIEAMSNLVKKAYAARGEIFKATQFFAAQEDPELPNPLRDAPLPQLSEEQAAWMAEVSQRDARLRVVTYLLLEDYEDAMIAAQDAMAEADASAMIQALNEVARVFKARDLNLVRGNQFLEYAKTGQGVNPLDGFWEEVQQ